MLKFPSDVFDSKLLPFLSWNFLLIKKKKKLLEENYL